MTDEAYRRQQFEQAVVQDDVGTVDGLLRAESQSNVLHIDASPLLVDCVSRRQFRMIDVLVAHGADLQRARNGYDGESPNAGDTAVMRNDLEMLGHLEGRGFDIGYAIEAQKGARILAVAAVRSELPVFKDVLGRARSSGCSRDAYLDALKEAVTSAGDFADRADVIAVLMDELISFDEARDDPMTLDDIGFRDMDFEYLPVIDARLPRNWKFRTEPLTEAIYGYTETDSPELGQMALSALQKMLEQDADGRRVLVNEGEVLQRAVETDMPAVLKRLMDHAERQGYAGAAGDIALDHALRAETAECLSWLLDRGHDPDQVVTDPIEMIRERNPDSPVLEPLTRFYEAKERTEFAAEMGGDPEASRLKPGSGPF